MHYVAVHRDGCAARLLSFQLTGLAACMVDALLPCRLRHWCADPPRLAVGVPGWAGSRGLLRLQRDRRPMLQLCEPVLCLSDASCCLPSAEVNTAESFQLRPIADAFQQCRNFRLEQ
jgi:hypothetical protein